MMTNERRFMHGRTGRLLLGGFLVLTLLKVWVGPLSWPSTAEAQIPNAGDQRLILLREVQQTNRILSEVLTTLVGLRQQTFRVKLTEPISKPTVMPVPTGR